jgi:hypothetical protein
MARCTGGLSTPCQHVRWARQALLLTRSCGLLEHSSGRSVTRRWFCYPASRMPIQRRTRKSWSSTKWIARYQRGHRANRRQPGCSTESRHTSRQALTGRDDEARHRPVSGSSRRHCRLAVLPINAKESNAPVSAILTSARFVAPFEGILRTDPSTQGLGPDIAAILRSSADHHRADRHPGSGTSGANRSDARQNVDSRRVA